MKKFNLVALLPIKENSERVKGKNFKLLGSKPLYKWILDSLLRCNDIELIVINTDSEILLNNKQLISEPKIKLRTRKPELCGDLVSMNLIIENDIESVAAENYLMTHATNPFITEKSITDAYNAFTNSDKYDSLFSVNRIQTRFYQEDGTAVNHDPDNLIRTQDLEPWLEENSCLYFFSRNSFSKTKARIGERPMMFETSALESFDIDDNDDWTISDAYARYLESGYK